MYKNSKILFFFLMVDKIQSYNTAISFTEKYPTLTTIY